MARSSFDLTDIIAPLWAIFWGGLFCFIDYGIYYSTPAITIDIEDIFNDLLGMTGLTWGIFRLRGVYFDGNSNWKLVVVSFVAGTLWLQTLFFTFGVLIPSGWLAGVVNPILNLAQLTAVLLFCMAMADICEVARLHASVAWWTALSFLARFIVVPFSILLLLSLLANVSLISSGFILAIWSSIEVPSLVIAILLVLLFLFATVITRNEAKRFIARPSPAEEVDEYTHFFDEEQEG